MTTSKNTGKNSGARTVQLLIAIFFVVLGIGVVVTSLRREAAERRPSPTVTVVPFVFPEVEPAQITRIEWEDPKQKRKVVFTKVPGDWLGIDGQNAPLQIDLTKLPTILRNLANLRYNRTVEVLDREKYGLEDGFLVRFNAGQTYALRIGDKNPDGSLVYVGRGDEKQALLVPSNQIDTLVTAVNGSWSAEAP